MSHAGEGGNVADLHAGVGGGLQHQQLGVALDQGLFDCPAIHEDNHMPGAFAEIMPRDVYHAHQVFLIKDHFKPTQDAAATAEC